MYLPGDAKVWNEEPQPMVVLAFYAVLAGWMVLLLTSGPKKNMKGDWKANVRLSAVLVMVGLVALMYYSKPKAE